MMGGFGEAKNADDQVKNLVNKHKSDVEGKLNQKFDTFEAVSYKTQVVAGTNYLVKVNVGNDKYVHVKIYKKLPHEGEETQLLEANGNKTKDCAL